MSNPANILDQFRNHAYHHILYACSNSRAANRLATNDFEISDFTEIGVSSEVLGEEIPADTDTPNDLTRTGTTREVLGKYVTLINGLKDTRYVIQKAEWETLTGASVNGTDAGNSLAVEGSITVQEPRGFEFMNLINNVQNAFESDATGVIFVLKTIWTGQTDAGNLSSNPDSATNVISDVRPLQFMIVDVASTFDASGGSYKIKFVGLNNGAARLPQISRAAEAVPFTPKSRVLSEVMSEFSAFLNDWSRKTHGAITKDLGLKPDIREEDADRLRRVEYEVVLNDPYNDDAYVLDNFDAAQKNKDTEDSVGAIHLGLKFTVEQVLQRIMSMSSKVQTDLTEGIEGSTSQADRVKYRYKISSAVEMERGQSDGNTTTDEEVMKIRYYINQFPEMTNVSVVNLLTNQSSDDATTEAQIRDNLITFDYIFTGRNVDIKNFDMKLNQGLLFLQTLRTTDNRQDHYELKTFGYVQNKDTINGQVARTGQASESTEDEEEPTLYYTIRRRTPIFPGTTVKDIVSKNINTPESMTNFNAAMQQHAALEQLQTTLEIRGNPYLLSNTGKSAQELSELDTQNTSTEEDRRQRIMKNWGRIPAIAKVNIRMPLNSDTLSSENSPELVNFWYDGYYYIFSIKHIFENGEFTQKLDMLSMPENNYFDPIETPEAEEGDTGNVQTPEAAPENSETQTRPTTRRARRKAQQARLAAERLERTTQPPPKRTTRKQRRDG